MAQKGNSTISVLLMTALAISLIAVIVVLTIQIMEYRHYSAPPSVWPSAQAGTPASLPLPARPAELESIVKDTVATTPQPVTPTVTNDVAVSADEFSGLEL